MKLAHVALKWLESTGDALGHALTSDGKGNLFVAGNYSGTIAGTAEAGGGDAFVARYDRHGELVWLRRIGSSAQDVASSVAVDDSGRVFVAGYTRGQLGESPAPGNTDVFVARYDLDGAEQKTFQFGSSAADIVGGVATDGEGNTYLAGWTHGQLGDTPSAGSADRFLARYDADGTRDWLKQFGVSRSDYATSVVVDPRGRILVTGALQETPGTSRIDTFLACHDAANGDPIWSVQLGTSTKDDAGSAVAVDAVGNIFVSGSTVGQLGPEAAQGRADMYLAKFGPDGNLVWIHQYGTAQSDSATCVAADGNGGAYVAGASTMGFLVNEDRANAFLAHYDRDGNRLWLEPMATPATEQIKGITVDERGTIAVVGFAAEAAVASSNAMLLALYEEVPETVADMWSLTRRHLMTLHDGLAALRPPS